MATQQVSTGQKVAFFNGKQLIELGEIRSAHQLKRWVTEDTLRSLDRGPVKVSVHNADSVIQPVNGGAGRVFSRLGTGKTLARIPQLPEEPEPVGIVRAVHKEWGQTIFLLPSKLLKVVFD